MKKLYCGICKCLVDKYQQLKLGTVYFFECNGIDYDVYRGIWVTRISNDDIKSDFEIIYTQQRSLRNESKICS